MAVDQRSITGIADTPLCRRCGQCCRWEGDVRVHDDEIDVIAQFLSLSVFDFTERFTRLTADRRYLRLNEQESGACVFLAESSECMINAVKPRQCRDFPLRWRTANYEKQCKAVLIKQLTEEVSK